MNAPGRIRARGRRPEAVLAGCGPGDPGLVSRAVVDAIRNSDIAFHDALVSPEILRGIPARKRVNVGKRGGRPSPGQDEINRKMIRAAKSGLRVIRLKGGDPFMFGRGGEEADALRRAGITVRVIPGISAAMAAAADAGFPLTDRRCSASLTMMTAASKNAGSLARRDWRSLVRFGGTWAFYMGLQAMPGVVRSLIKAGASPTTPAAVISSAATPARRTVTAALRDIAGKAARMRVKSPAIVIIGRVVALRPNPLAGKAVLVLRPAKQSGRLASLLRQRGARVSAIAAIDIEPIRPNPALARMIRRIGDYDWILLTSANTVRLLARALSDSRRRAKLAVIGPGTREALAAIRLKADLIPDGDFRAEGLADAILKSCRKGTRLVIALPQAEGGRPVLAKTIRGGGHRVDAVSMYRTTIPREAKTAARVRSWIRSNPGGLIALTSASIARALASFTRGIGTKNVRAASIGPVTTAEAESLSIRIDAEAGEARLPDLLDAIESLA